MCCVFSISYHGDLAWLKDICEIENPDCELNIHPQSINLTVKHIPQVYILIKT